MTTTTTGSSPLEMMRARRQELRKEAQSLREEVDAIYGRTGKDGVSSPQDQRSLARVERRSGPLREELTAVDERIDELVDQETRTAAANEARRLSGVGIDGGWGTSNWGASGWSVGAESRTYNPSAESPSFFRDLLWAQRGDANAADRLRRNNAETGLEARALSTTAGAGGEFGPPLWLVEEFIKMARPGRVTADLFRPNVLPPNQSSVNIPKVATGTTTAVQATQNATVSQTDITSTSLTSGITTIAGKQVVSQQLVDQSGIPFDRIILEDLTADYAKQLGVQVLSGTGANGQLRGYLTPSSTNVVTWTQATPTAGGFYSQLAKLQGQINTSRFMPPTAVVMAPRRWAWLASYVDSTGRPLVVPTSGGYNSMAQPGEAVAAGHVGSILGMDVFTDPNIPTNLGGGTNQDVVLMFPRDDIWFWESDLRAEVIPSTYADSLGVLFRVYNYTALICDRYLASLGQVSGTGLVSPVFAS